MSRFMSDSAWFFYSFIAFVSWGSTLIIFKFLSRDWESWLSHRPRSWMYSLFRDFFPFHLFWAVWTITYLIEVPANQYLWGHESNVDDSTTSSTYTSVWILSSLEFLFKPLWFIALLLFRSPGLSLIFIVLTVLCSSYSIAVSAVSFLDLSIGFFSADCFMMILFAALTVDFISQEQENMEEEMGIEGEEEDDELQEEEDKEKQKRNKRRDTKKSLRGKSKGIPNESPTSTTDDEEESSDDVEKQNVSSTASIAPSYVTQAASAPLSYREPLAKNHVMIVELHPNGKRNKN